MVFLNRLLIHLKYLYFRVVDREMYKHPERYIPKDTMYCYDTEPGHSFKTFRRCPFHRRFDFLPEQENGYCYFLNKSDVDLDGWGLLWDECKECGINYEE
jgi:Fe-S-cluster containining protein